MISYGREKTATPKALQPAAKVGYATLLRDGHRTVAKSSR
jgi:hypothetical protein